MIETKNLTPRIAAHELQKAKDAFAAAQTVLERVSARAGVEELEGQIRDLKERHKKALADLEARLAEAQKNTDHEQARYAVNSAAYKVRECEHDVETARAMAEIRSHGFEHGDRVSIYEIDNSARWGATVPAYRYRHTGEAVIEAYRHGDPYPENLRWSAPKPGSVILRLLTKDGTLGKKITDRITYPDDKGDYLYGSIIFKAGADPMRVRPLKELAP